MSELRAPPKFPTHGTAVIQLGLSENTFVDRLATAVALGCRRVVADLGEADMVGWSTLSALHHMGRRLRREGGGLVVATHSQGLARMLRLTLLSEGFSVVDESEQRERPAHDDERDVVELELPPDRSFDAVGRLVAAGVASRVGLGTDRIDDLLVALDRIRQRPELRGSTTVLLRPSERELRLEIGPLASHDSARELARVLSTVVDAADSRGIDQGFWVTLRLPTRLSGVERRCPA